MTKLSWQEVKAKASAFAHRWKGTTSESAEKQTFWNEFFAVFGRDRKAVASFEYAVRNIRERFGKIDLLWGGTLLVEHKSTGEDLTKAQSQAFQYIADLANEGRDDAIPRFVVLSDFHRFALFDLDPDDEREPSARISDPAEPHTFFLAQLPQNVRRFAFIKGESVVRLKPEDPANERAYELMCRLHDELAQGGVERGELERLLVRILFCLFAEDTDVFEPNAFQSFIRESTREDGTDLGARLNELFDVLNREPAKRPVALSDELARFPYVNGQLFADRLGFAAFTKPMRDALLRASEFHWARVSPAVFGSLFQGVMAAPERRQQGAHYTSERDILKVVQSLFMNDLRAEFEAARADRSTGRKARLQRFHDRLRSLEFLDPACGCGNFLVLAYRELRRLELDVLREIYPDGQRLLDIRSVVQVDVDQFYGIEIDEWPARIAEVAMWLMDHQMNLLVSGALGKSLERLPLRNSPHIRQGNALRFDWNELLPATKCSFVLGNPPFVGKKARNEEQQEDMESVWGDTEGARVLDYVSCWFRRAADYVTAAETRIGFVATNSITQGEQVGLMWPVVLRENRLSILFAHRTFQWTSDARGKAHVHCVIIGLGCGDAARKPLFDYGNDDHPTCVFVSHINPYLAAAADVYLENRSRPICEAPPMTFGSMPNDGGNLVLSDDERAVLLREAPDAKAWIRPLVTAHEMLHGIRRWCLWLSGVAPSAIRQVPAVLRRVEAVRAYRRASKREATQRLADRATEFGEIRQPQTNYIAVPRHSSEDRAYVPMSYFQPDVIIGDSCLAVADASLFHFGCMTSSMHMAWMRAVCGRLESRYRYSATLVYNNFPWPRNTEVKKRDNVEAAAREVLAIRVRFSKPPNGSTLADLYDPRTMPSDLSKAHAALDRAVERCYRSEPFATEQDRVGFLFQRYEELQAPLVPKSRARQRRLSPGCEDPGEQSR